MQFLQLGKRLQPLQLDQSVALNTNFVQETGYDQHDYRQAQDPKFDQWLDALDPPNFVLAQKKLFKVDQMVNVLDCLDAIVTEFEQFKCQQIVQTFNLLNFVVD